MERVVLVGLAALRWAALTWMATVLLVSRHQLLRPWLAVLLVAATVAYTVLATGWLRRSPARLMQPRVVVGEIVLAMALLVSDGWAYGADHVFSTSQSLGSVWPLVAVLDAGVGFGGRRGAAIGFVLGAGRLGAVLANGVRSFDGERTLSLVNTAVFYAVAGALAGYLVELLRRAEGEISAARAREEVARTLHDGVLQTLALVERRSTDRDLVRLAREQDRELRRYLFGDNLAEKDGTDLGAALRRAASRFEEVFGVHADVLVAEDLPRLDEPRVAAVSRAVSEALTNAGKHSHARRVVVFAEPAESGLFCSVKDDGVGFDPDAGTPGVGISGSIVGRIRDVDGRGRGQEPTRGGHRGVPVGVERPTVVLADDHPIWRDGVRGDLTGEFEVVGEAGTATEAIAAVRATRPDLVVCDLHMPDGGGIAVVRACAAATRVVMLTVSEQERDLLDAVAAGAVGYLVKSTPGPELVAALRRVVAGEPVFSPALAFLVLGEFRRLAKATTGAEPLSDREREVLQLVARGHSYREIGGELHIAEKTVENHVRNILGKLHLSRRHELVRFAIEHGLE